MTTLAPGALWRPVHARTATRVRPELGLVMHCQQGDNSPQPWFNRPDSRSSSTWWIAKRGQLEQYVDVDAHRAWAQGSGNGSYHSVEFEGWVGQPLTTAQLNTAAALYAWGHVTRGWALKLADAPGATGFGWHGMGAAHGWGHPDCPGPIRRGQRTEILRRAGLVLHPAPLEQKTTTTTEDDVMNADQEKKLDTAISIGKQIIRQLGGDWDAGNWPGWPQLGNATVVDALGEVLTTVNGLSDELLDQEVTVRDPKTGQPATVRLRYALTRAAEASEARQIVEGLRAKS